MPARRNPSDAPQERHQAEKLKREIKKAGRRASAVAEQEAVAADPTLPVPPDVPLTAAQEAWLGAKQQADIYRKARQKLDEELGSIAQRRLELDEEAQRIADEEAAVKRDERAIMAARAALEDDQRQHKEADQQLTARRAHMDRREKELHALALEIEQRRIDADAGFLEQERAHLRRLAEQRDHLLADVGTERQRIIADIEQRRAEQEEHWRRRAAELEKMRQSTEADLNQHRAKSQERDEQLRERERRIRAQEEIQEEDRAYLREQAELAVTAQMKRLELEIEKARKEYEVVVEHASNLEQQLHERNESLRLAGHESPSVLRGRLQQLTTENAELLHRLATIPIAADRQLLEQIQDEHEQCGTIRARLESTVAKLRSENNSFLIATSELEELREHRDTLAHSVDVHKKLLSEKQVELNKIINSASAPRPFPGLDELDGTADLQNERHTNDTPPDLADLVPYIQQRILADRDHRRGPTPLAYRDRDIRCLLGGLAMSRLHILQGISGIGKTTFPKAFASAIGAAYSVIEVQAGWRDRQDLVGHLNAFERRYYETAFTKAVYQAGCTAHQNRPFFIILDEMNLSHPEQYFADVLSGLENIGEPLRLQLTNHPTEPKAQLLTIDKGTHLPVPENIWFFGTANHDETTVQFADKTYDRAHIIELPTVPPGLVSKNCPRRDAISHRALQRSFNKAWSDHRENQNVVVSFLRADLAKYLALEFKIGWGPRLEQQIRDFTPVVVAAGGTVGEAADHILATRVLRRLSGRYNLPPEKLQELRDLIDECWPKLVKGTIDETNDALATKALLDELIESKG